MLFWILVGFAAGIGVVALVYPDFKEWLLNKWTWLSATLIGIVALFGDYIAKLKDLF